MPELLLEGVETFWPYKNNTGSNADGEVHHLPRVIIGNLYWLTFLSPGEGSSWLERVEQPDLLCRTNIYCPLMLMLMRKETK